MSVDMIGSATTSSSSSHTTETNKLDRDAFLKLLITQLSNQDPLNPMEDQQFIAQLAQFSSLEQMQMVNRTLAPFIEMMGPFLQNQVGFSAASWVGRSITARDPLVTSGDSEAAIMSGRVESVKFTQDGPLLRMRVPVTEVDEATGETTEVMKDREIPLAYVISVSQ